MQIDEKLIKQITEMKYLTMENTDRYRTILRYFYLHDKKFQYWIYQEEVYEEMMKYTYFQEMSYTPELCQQDLTTLVNWKNLLTMQDTRHVTSIEEFKNKKFRYRLSEYSVEIERLVLRLENLSVEGASLEPTLLERIKNNLMKINEVPFYDSDETYVWWNELNHDFIRLNQNYNDYIRELNGIKADEMMKSREFLIFKDKLIEYLRMFIKSLQRNVVIIEGYLAEISEDWLESVLEQLVLHQLSIPRIDREFDEVQFRDISREQFISLYNWFVGEDGKENEASKLLDATNEIIRKITRYATRISEMNGTGANRKEEYAKVASIFAKTKSIEEAHKLSAFVFGMEKGIHLKGEFYRHTDSMNSGVYEETPEIILIAPRTRTYREKAHRSPIVDRTEEKKLLLEQIRKEQEENDKMMEALIVDGKIDFGELPVIQPQMREILLIWLSNGLETADKKAKTESGKEYHIDIKNIQNTCKITCSDGVFVMPHMKIIFQE
ncbi:MAG: TIGR02677 family protein [Eubacteriales bacterium]